MSTKRETQLNKVLKELKRKGCITRNECLRMYITRLSAIIFDLKELGYEINGYYTYKPVGGKSVRHDFRYDLVNRKK